MDKCQICSKEVGKYQNGIQLIRYGYSGPMMPLCEDCMKELINWIEMRRSTKEFQVKEHIT